MSVLCFGCNSAVILIVLTALLFTFVKSWPAYSDEPIILSDDHTILTECTVNDEQVAGFVSTSYDPHMLVAGIEYQVARLGRIPRDRSAIGVLGMGTATVTYDIFSTGDIVKHPIHEDKV